MKDIAIVTLLIALIISIKLLLIEYKISKSQAYKCTMFNMQSNKYKQCAIAGHILFEHIFTQKNKLSCGIAVVNLYGVILDCNNAFKEISKQKNPIGRNFREFTHKDYIDVDVKQVEKLINYKITHYNMRKAYTNNGENRIYVDLCVICLRKVNDYPSTLIAFIEAVKNENSIIEKNGHEQRI